MVIDFVSAREWLVGLGSVIVTAGLVIIAVLIIVLTVYSMWKLYSSDVELDE